MPPTGYFTDASPLREVVGHRVTALSGPRALLVMAAHPVAFQGFFAHTGALDDPYARLQRTAQVQGEIVAAVLRLDDGAVFNGKAQTTKPRAASKLQLAS